MRGLIGYPLGHSYSKIIHEYLNHKNYQLIELNEEQFHDFMQKKKFNCINVTIPYKQKVIPYLDHIDPLALRINAINCIVNDNGILKGYNTDYYGFKYMIEANDFIIKDKVVAICGTGGASKSIYEVVKDMQAKSIYLVSRNKKEGCINYDELAGIGCQILINTTPVGMFPDNDGLIYDLDRLNELEAVVDIVYNPINTRLVLEARNRNIKAIGGLEMLIAQAVKAVEIFDNTTISKDKIQKCNQLIAKEKLNIVLIGMPSCGKSTIANILKDKLGYELYEMDQIITDNIGTSIKEYFDTYGEEAFRKQETQCAKELRNKHRAIISCGGGIIKNQINMNYLRENGICIFIDRDIDKLIATDDRPLSNDYEKIKVLYEQRYHLYQKYSDFSIKNNGDIMETVNQILERVG